MLARYGPLHEVMNVEGEQDIHRALMPITVNCDMEGHSVPTFHMMIPGFRHCWACNLSLCAAELRY